MSLEPKSPQRSHANIFRLNEKTSGKTVMFARYSSLSLVIARSFTNRPFSKNYITYIYRYRRKRKNSPQLGGVFAFLFS